MNKENIMLLIASILFTGAGVFKLIAWAQDQSNTTALFFGLGFLMVPVVNFIRWKKKSA